MGDPFLPRSEGAQSGISAMPIAVTMGSKQLKESKQSQSCEEREIRRTGDKGRLCLWCTMNLETLGISVLGWFQYLLNWQGFSLVSMVVIPQLDRGAKARTSPTPEPALAGLIPFSWEKAPWHPGKWNDCRERRREVSPPAWNRSETFPPYAQGQPSFLLDMLLNFRFLNWWDCWGDHHWNPTRCFSVFPSPEGFFSTVWWCVKTLGSACGSANLLCRTGGIYSRQQARYQRGVGPSLVIHGQRESSGLSWRAWNMSKLPSSGPNRPGNYSNVAGGFAVLHMRSPWTQQKQPPHQSRQGNWEGWRKLLKICFLEFDCQISRKRLDSSQKCLTGRNSLGRDCSVLFWSWRPSIDLGHCHQPPK